MSNGFGRGRGTGRGFRGGMGFGFRGSSPPWPYVGRGRGGLPRCGYYLSGPGASRTLPYQQSPYPLYGETPFAPPMTKEEELDFLRGQAEAIKGQLAQIETRMREMEAEE